MANETYPPCVGLNVTGINYTRYFDVIGTGNVYNTFIYSATLFQNYSLILLYIVGFPGNLIAVYIWLRQRLRKSSGIYLAALGIGNVLFLTMHLFLYFMIYWRSNTYNFPVWCEMYMILNNMSQEIIPILVLGFTVERYIAVCHPYKQRCTQRTAKITVTCMYLADTLQCCVHAWFWTYDYESGKCRPRLSALEGGESSIMMIWLWVEQMTLFLIFPLAVLCTNIRVIIETRRIQRSLSMRWRSRRGKHKIARTYMLLAVSFYHICVSVPVSIVYLLVNKYPGGSSTLSCKQEVLDDPVWTAHFRFLIIRMVVQFFGYSQYVANFYIYLLTSAHFRGEFRIAIMSKIFGVKSDEQSITGESEWYTKYGASFERRDSNKRSVSDITPPHSGTWGADSTDTPQGSVRSGHSARRGRRSTSSSRGSLGSKSTVTTLSSLSSAVPASARRMSTNTSKAKDMKVPRRRARGKVTPKSFLANQSKNALVRRVVSNSRYGRQEMGSSYLHGEVIGTALRPTYTRGKAMRTALEMNVDHLAAMGSAPQPNSLYGEAIRSAMRQCLVQREAIGSALLSNSFHGEVMGSALRQRTLQGEAMGSAVRLKSVRGEAIGSALQPKSVHAEGIGSTVSYKSLKGEATGSGLLPKVVRVEVMESASRRADETEMDEAPARSRRKHDGVNKSQKNDS